MTRPSRPFLALAARAALGLALLDLSITGMTCAACVRRIEKAVRAVPGVDAASVNLVTQRAAVRHDPRAAVRDALVAAIENLPEREKLVMSLYYERELNLKEIGAVLGVTESRACQLHGQALGRLRARLADWRGEEDGET